MGDWVNIVKLVLPNFSFVGKVYIAQPWQCVAETFKNTWSATIIKLQKRNLR